MTNTTLFNQPKPFYVIFLIELWQNFSDGGVQVLLTLFLVKNLNLTEANSFNLFSAYFALSYCLTAAGGYIGDKVLGTKRTIILGSVTLFIGYLLLSVSVSVHNIIYLALATIAIGISLFKSNPASLLAKSYTNGDQRLDSAFTMYYMAINVGGFVSYLMVPILAQRFGWKIGFLSCAIGILLTTACFFAGKNTIKNIGSTPDSRPLNYLHLARTIIAIIIAIMFGTWMLKHLDLSTLLFAAITIIILSIYIKEITLAKGLERNKIIVALILILQASIFFTLYLQIPTSLNFFAINSINHSIFGIEINPVSFQSLNTFWLLSKICGSFQAQVICQVHDIRRFQCIYRF